MKTYVTFGPDQIHEVGGRIFDRDCVAVVNGGREEVFRIFGSMWCLEFSEERWDDSKMSFFPRGYIEVTI